MNPGDDGSLSIMDAAERTGKELAILLQRQCLLSTHNGH